MRTARTYRHLHRWALAAVFLPLCLSAYGQAADSTEAYIPCSHRGHVECIRITGREVFQHGTEGRWSEHWWRMSYIGRACEERLGRPKGVFLETLFAVPHYMAMGVMNVAGLTKHALTQEGKKADPGDENRGLLGQKENPDEK